MESLREGVWKTMEQSGNGEYWGWKGTVWQGSWSRGGGSLEFNSLYQYCLYTGYLFYTLGYDPMQVYVIAQTMAPFASGIYWLTD